ncbi:MAG: AAA family ATPase [Candidatus Cloacimonetes bacterium]|nr:AAA family ATPase [Candidatus Cloacimonadota bacterium]
MCPSSNDYSKISGIVYLIGMPGVGKLSIAKKLNETLHWKLLDNHTIINCVTSVLDRSDQNWSSIVMNMRKTLFTGLHKISTDNHQLIVTDAIASCDDDIFQNIKDLSTAWRCNLYIIRLSCSESENIFRLTQEGRQSNHKLVDKDLLVHIRNNYHLFQPQDYELCIDLETSDLTIQESADHILNWLESFNG